MSYISKKFFLPVPQFAFRFLLDEYKATMGEAQKIIDKQRVFVDDELLSNKGSKIVGNVSVIVFEGHSRGLMPVFETEDFAVFEKPSGVMMHPKNRNDEYTLNDEIKSLYGNDANCAHRIDKSTSGLVLVGKNKRSEIELKALFASRSIKKKYLALVEGKFEKEMLIDVPLKRGNESNEIRLKVYADEHGKISQTRIVPLEYFQDKDVTLIEAMPLTGRQHQIRAHMFHVKHKIVGDSIYGLEEIDAMRFLDGEMSEDERVQKTRASRLLLHAQSLSFEDKGILCNKESTFKAKNEFYEFCRKG